MDSSGHRANILRSYFTKIGIDCTYDADSQWKNHWVQMFGGDLYSPDTIITTEIFETLMTVKRGGTYTISKNFSGTIRINTSDAMTSAGDLSNVKIVAYSSTAYLTIKNSNVVNESGSVINFGTGNKLILTGTNGLTTSDTWDAVVNIGGGIFYC